MFAFGIALALLVGGLLGFIAGSPALLNAAVVGDRDCEDQLFIPETILADVDDSKLSAKIKF